MPKLIISLLFTFSIVLAQIVISEVMFDLDGPDSPNEFVEIYNSSNIVVNLANWKIMDSNSVDDILGDNLSLQPFSFAIILEGDYSGFYDNYFPENTLLLEVDDSSIGNGLKNSNDYLYLVSNVGDTVSSMNWSSGTTPGFSYEKIVLEIENNPLNWRESIDSLGTPGFQNSISGYSVDIAIDSVWHSPIIPEIDEPVSLFTKITNNGLFLTSSDIYQNENYLQTISIEPLDYAIVESQITINNPGQTQVEFSAETLSDYNLENNAMIDSIKIAFNYHDIIVNEIMYHPISDVPEWIEIYNNSEIPIDLLGWMINDQDEYLIGFTQNIIVLPNEYVVITKSENEFDFFVQQGFPTLNNSGDNIFLFDLTGKMIDHVDFNIDWGGGDGYSLERITHYLDSNNPSNWGTSVASTGSTPFVENSLFVNKIETIGTIVLEPNPFSPNGDGIDDNLIIAYHLPFTRSVLQIDIYDVRGRKIASPIQGEIVSMEGITRWNGHNSSNQKCRVGQYLLVIEATDSYSNNSWKTIERIILAKNLN
jgi:hypothetical protein